jgi:hypothetical protein
MKTTHVVASELFLVLLLAGCANLPMDQACRAGLESEFKVLDANGHAMQYHRSANFVVLLFEADDKELAGDYEGCLHNLEMARVHHRHEPTYRTPITYSWDGQNQSIRGSANDGAHHAAGHTHHHGHN